MTGSPRQAFLADVGVSMASDLDDFQPKIPEDKFGPESYPPREERGGHGCFFYGCITAIVLAILMAVALGVIGYFGFRAFTKFIEQNTSPTPMVLPKTTMSQDDRKTMAKRVDAFKAALDKDEDTEPLVLNADELNAVLAEKGQTEGKVYFLIEKDKLTGEVSLPLGELGIPGGKGRYFNGKATFRVSLQAGRLVVFVDSAEVNGKPLPDQFMNGLRNQNLAKDAMNDPQNAAFLDKLDSIEIKDGTIIIKAKPRAERVRSRSNGQPQGNEPRKEAEKTSDQPTPGTGAGPSPKADEKPKESTPEKESTPTPPKEDPANQPAKGQPEPKPLAALSGGRIVSMGAALRGFPCPA